MENTVTSPVTTTSVGLRYGLLTGLAWVIIDFILRATGLSFKYSLYISALLIVYIAGIVLAHRAFKQHNAGLMSYGQGVVIALILAVVVGVLASIFSYIYITLIDPNYVTRMRADMETWLSTLPGVQPEQVEKQLADLNEENLKSPAQLFKGLFSSAIYGLVMGLIVSAFHQKERARV